MNTIRFYRTNEPFGEFSNFASYPMVLLERTWPTTEHFFQAQKFAGAPDEEEIRQAPPQPSLLAWVGNEHGP